MSQLTRTEQLRLKTILAEPEFAALTNPDSAAEALNAKGFTTYRPLEPQECLDWLAEDSHLAKLKVGSTNENVAVATACTAALMILSVPTARLDLSKPSIAAKVDLIRNAGILTDELDSLYSRAEISISRIEQEFGVGRSVDNQDVYVAREELQ